MDITSDNNSKSVISTSFSIQKIDPEASPPIPDETKRPAVHTIMAVP